MTDLSTHFKCMANALFVAYRALKIGETPVACIFVNEVTGNVLAFGCNNTNESLNGTRHAEFEAIDKILEDNGLLDADMETINNFFKDVILYVTIEPCIMCALALQQMGVKKVYFGAANERFGGNGTTIKVQGESSYQSIGGICRVEAIHLLRLFYIQQNDSAPVPKIKKNKEIYDKSFPPNLKFPNYLKPNQFQLEFGESRYNIFYGPTGIEQEITPKTEKGYQFKDLCSKSELNQLPELHSLYSNSMDSIEDDYKELCEVLPIIDDQCCPSFLHLNASKRARIE